MESWISLALHTVGDELFALPDPESSARMVVRVTAAVILGGLVGYERERRGTAAGMRTHMLVALGAALFVIVPLEAGVGMSEMSRVLQGVTSGIGFLGAGAVMKMSQERTIKGLTTAAGIWLTAAIGVAAGMGMLLAAGFAAGVAIFILAHLHGWCSKRQRVNRVHNAAEVPAGAT